MNFESFINGKVYEAFNWIFKMLLINLLWLITTVLGLGIFTFMPATIALFILVKSVINNEEVPIIKTFFKIVKKEYIKSQKIFLVLLIIGSIIYFNFKFYLRINSLLTSVGIVIIFMILIFYILICTHICIVYIYYPHVKVFRTFKLAFLISMLYAFKTFLIIAVNVIIGFLLLYFKILFAFAPLIFMSLFAYITLSLLNTNYSKLVKDNEILTVKKYYNIGR
ncbi:MAG: hypothetical protein K0Q49_260 [Haloplasmataceae bacterium]|jgi:uncharacterized membrane protein YesL|nr:hypothetical protein [Haloplasmataceae bacterium]